MGRTHHTHRRLSAGPFWSGPLWTLVLLALVISGLLASSAPGGSNALPTLSINDVEGTNYQTASSTATFTVTLSPASTSTVTVDFATRRSDEDGEDFVPTAGTLTFAPGETTKQIVIQLAPEPGETSEPDEIFYVDLTNANGATFAKDAGVLIIHFHGQPTPEQVNVTATGNGDQCVKTVGSDTCQPLDGEAQYAIDDIKFINPGGGKIDLHTTDGQMRFFGTSFDLDKLPADSSGTGKETTLITLHGGNFAACGRTTSGRTTSGVAAGKPKTAVRRLWGKGKGHFRTRGRYSSGTVRGTVWLTSDRCDGTRTYVQQGVVRVFDFTTKKTIYVPAGHSYVAHPPNKP